MAGFGLEVELRCTLCITAVARIKSDLGGVKGGLSGQS